MFSAAQHLSNLDELLVLVVWELDVVADARGHAGDEAVKGVHLVLVPGEHDDEVLLVVLHHVEQDLDRLLPTLNYYSHLVID